MDSRCELLSSKLLQQPQSSIFLIRVSSNAATPESSTPQHTHRTRHHREPWSKDLSQDQSYVVLRLSDQDCLHSLGTVKWPNCPSFIYTTSHLPRLRGSVNLIRSEWLPYLTNYQYLGNYQFEPLSSHGSSARPAYYQEQASCLMTLATSWLKQ